MVCFGLNDAECGLLIQVGRRIDAALSLVARYGVSGAMIAAMLILVAWFGARWAEYSAQPM
jgi:hypothetical protein